MSPLLFITSVLVVDGVAQAEPAKVTTVRRDPTLQVLYPYINDVDTLYRLRFPRFPGPKPLADLPGVSFRQNGGFEEVNKSSARNRS